MIKTVFWLNVFRFGLDLPLSVQALCLSLNNVNYIYSQYFIGPLFDRSYVNCCCLDLYHIYRHCHITCPQPCGPFNIQDLFVVALC